jgi:hypothetical protein
VRVHFTRTSASLLNLVEVWFGIIERQAIHRGTFGNVRELTTAIKKFITGWNDRAHPFMGPTADGNIMASVTSGNTHGPCVIIGERAAEILTARHRL